MPRTCNRSVYQCFLLFSSEDPHQRRMLSQAVTLYNARSRLRYESARWDRNPGCMRLLEISVSMNQWINQSIYLSRNVISTGPDTKGGCNLR